MSATHVVDPVTALVSGFSLHTTITTDTTTNGTGVDMLNADYPVHALVSVGDYGDASTQTVVHLEESADNSTFADISGGAQPSVTLAASATANDSTTFFLTSHNRTQRYVRVAAVTSGGGTPSVPISAVVFANRKISGSGDGHKGVVEN